ncbi:hypothetical protein ABZ517_05555 [Streptomyces scabiei]|uniref:hypothetical protein n=1 Tax=Streptomyces scabiei TaxID=1930 RepID=UPI0033DA965B
MFQLAIPDTFRPEDYGWEVSNPIVPHQQREAAMQELHRFGYVSTTFKRWQIPFAFPAVLSLAGYDSGRRLYRVFYMPPYECHDQDFTLGQILREIRCGAGWPEGSPERPFVSQPEK